MVTRIYWQDQYNNELASPFLRGDGERHLRITFHSSSFIDSTNEETEAIEALRQLSPINEIEMLDTKCIQLISNKLENYQQEENSIKFSVYTPTGVINSAISYLDRWKIISSQLSGSYNIEDVTTQNIYNDLLLAQSHRILKYDLFITLSEILLSNRDQEYLQKVNPCRPSEAARILGYYLRSRDKYILYAQGNGTVSFDRGLFYWVLTRHRLPNMWKYFSGCMYSEGFRKDNTSNIGQSILMRCSRVVQARDEIAGNYYIPQNGNTREYIMYHFEYITLLLSGIFDALAVIAKRSYNIHINERYASFKNETFQKSLKNHGALELFELITCKKFEKLMILLYELRNTIHKASFPTISSDELSYVIILPDYINKFQEAAKELGSLEKWGISKIDDLVFEPFTYAVTLIEECFTQIDNIAKFTNILGLFPTGITIPKLIDRPPEDDTFNANIRKRINILGW